MLKCKRRETKTAFFLFADALKHKKVGSCSSDFFIIIDFIIEIITIGFV